MGMATILFSNAEPIEQIDNTPSTEGHMWNLMKISQAVSEKISMYIAHGHGQITPGDKILIVTIKVCYFDRTS